MSVGRSYGPFVEIYVASLFKRQVDFTDSCNSHTCQELNCLNGGMISGADPDTCRCDCPLGTVGHECQSSKDMVSNDTYQISCI